jgi:hypothetical protein
MTRLNAPGSRRRRTGHSHFDKRNGYSWLPSIALSTHEGLGFVDVLRLVGQRGRYKHAPPKAAGTGPAEVISGR